jgi:small subunit ribosomal protein S1
MTPLYIFFVVVVLLCSLLSSESYFLLDRGVRSSRKLPSTSRALPPSIEVRSLKESSFQDVAFDSLNHPQNAMLNRIKERSSGRTDVFEDEADESWEAAYADAWNDINKVHRPYHFRGKFRIPVNGQTLIGTVIDMDNNGAYIDVGGKMSCFLPVKEVSLAGPVSDINSVLQVGQEVIADTVGTLRGMPVVSLRPQQLDLAFDNLLKLNTTDTAFKVTVVEVNRGGAVCQLEGGLRAFLPVSQILGVVDMTLIGQEVSVKLLNFDMENGKVVVSQRKVQMARSMAKMKLHSVMHGTITGMRNFGAFVELDGKGISALLHISEITNAKVDPLTFFTVGQRVKVMIIAMNGEGQKGRVAVSTKALEVEPGDMMRDMEKVFEFAEETAKTYVPEVASRVYTRDRDRDRGAAKDVMKEHYEGVASTSNIDTIASVSASIESILASIVTEGDANVKALVTMGNNSESKVKGIKAWSPKRRYKSIDTMEHVEHTVEEIGFVDAKEKEIKVDEETISKTKANLKAKVEVVGVKLDKEKTSKHIPKHKAKAIEKVSGKNDVQVKEKTKKTKCPN